MKIIPRILITPGEPAGVGPDITIKIAQKKWPVEIVVIGDPDLFMTRAERLGLPLTLNILDPHKPAIISSPGTLTIHPLSLAKPVNPGTLNPANAQYVIRCLEVAADYCLQGRAHALVTGPIHKGILNDAHIPFTGHTEFLATRCGSSRVIMLFVAPEMKVALLTTHLPLSQVPKAITTETILSTVRLLHNALQTRFGIHQPRILVCGLNPHAGENGYLGREEIDTIIPALNQLRADTIHVEGPLPADTIFTEKYLKNSDAILAMYHDQALPVVKYLGFGHAVNMTLGLPIIRTSVDHGTALDVAGTSLADAGSLEAALALAIQLSNP